MIRAGLAGLAKTELQMTNISKAELAELIAQTVTQILAGQAASPTKAPAISAPGNSLEAKDRALISGLKRKGIPLAEIVLMDRNDPKKPYNVKPFKQWLAEGRMVRKGQHGIRGLFHVTQTDPIKPAAKAQPAVPAEQKALFAQAKAVLKKKQAKAPTLV
jgi:hypothetical protein